jgi:hypothetical protein
MREPWKLVFGSSSGWGWSCSSGVLFRARGFVFELSWFMAGLQMCSSWVRFWIETEFGWSNIKS